MEEDMARSDVLIVGAGPTGLVLALWLTKLGAKPRIIDKTAEPGTTSPAHWRSTRERVESYEQKRIAFARRLVQTTDRVFMLATAEGKLAEIIRTRIAPIIF